MHGIVRNILVQKQGRDYPHDSEDQPPPGSRGDETGQQYEKSENEYLVCHGCGIFKFYEKNAVLTVAEQGEVRC